MDEPQEFEPVAYDDTAALPYPPLPQTAPPTAKPPHRWRRGAMKTVALGAVVVLAAGTSGVVVHQLDDHNGTTSAAASSTALVPAAAGVASVQSALAKAEKSVVIINDTMTSSSSSGRGGFGGFGNQAYTSSAAGTGIIISADGEVVTNAHVVNGASNIQVTLPDGTKKSATVLGADTSKDLAVLKISGVSGLTPATWADSDSAQVGDEVIAIGNAEGYGGSPSVTQGILSAKNRSLSSSDGGNDSEEDLSGLLQTDAAINPGNSGGPLVDAAGDVLGIDTAVATGTTSEPAQNIGFAIPSNTVVAAIPALKAGGTSSGSSNSNNGSGAVLGVSVSDQSGTSGAVVEQVVSGSGADKAGLQSGDVITKVGSTSITGADDLAAAIQSHKVGDTVTITFVRNGSTQTAKATLGAASTTQG
jgi:putative serine protease PepD